MKLKLATFLAAVAVSGCGTSVSPDPKGEEPYARYLAALDFADQGDAGGLLPLLADPHPLVRSGAAVGLVRLGRAEYVPQLIDLTFDREVNDAMVRSEACRALAVFRDPRAVPRLLMVLRDDAAVEVRRTAALSLEAFAERAEVLAALVAVLPRDVKPGEAARAGEERSAAVQHCAHVVLTRVSKRSDLPRQRDPWEEWLKDPTKPPPPPPQATPEPPK